MSDIAERLKNFKERYDTSIDFPSKCRIAEEIGGYTLDNMPAIISALQFAEDMQRLESVDVQIERGDQPDDEWLITIHPDGEEIQVQHSDIFTAARNAVQQLEGM